MLPHREEERHQRVALFAAFALSNHVALARVVIPEVAAWLAIPEFDERQEAGCNW